MTHVFSPEITDEGDAGREAAEGFMGLGPFPSALRLAIKERGLTLDRIHHRLKHRGVELSAATLSYWQSGRRRPERLESLHALPHLESILQLPPGALSSLLGPPRPRGRNCDERRTSSLQSIWQVGSGPAATLLSAIEESTATRFCRVSQHDRLTVDADRRLRSVHCWQLLRARSDGQDRCTVVHDWGPSAEESVPIFGSLRNCDLGTVHTRAGVGIFAAELVLERPLDRGETVVLEYELHNPSTGRPQVRTEDRFVRRIGELTREYLLEVCFDPAALPTRCQAVSEPGHDPSAPGVRNLPIDRSNSAHALALDVRSGRFGIRWSWEGYSEPQ